MKSARRLSTILLFLAVGGMHSATAEDIDLFLENEEVNDARPNVLLVLDNASPNNSNTSITTLSGEKSDKLTMLRQVLINIVDPLDSPFFPACNATVTPRVPADCVTRAEVDALLSKINVGLMINNPKGTGTDVGGYVRYHIRRMDSPTNRNNLRAKLSVWDKGRYVIPESSNAPYAKSMHEAYLYYGGKPAYMGFKSTLYDSAARDGDRYRSPASDSCQDNYILFVGNGGPDTAEDKDVGGTDKDPGLIAGIGGKLPTDPVQFTPSLFASNWFDEYARTLKKQDVVPGLDGVQNVTTYTIAVQTPDDNNYTTSGMQSARELLKSGAALGGGQYYEAKDGQQVMKAFVDMLRKFQAVDSVFAASTLPVSVNVRGTFLNQVYMGQFRPDANAGPRWPGNLKQYRIALDGNGNPKLADRFGAAVEDTVNGFILPDRTSYWTVDSTYWAFSPIGNPPSANDAPDGNIVEKGGVAQRLRQDFATGQATRKLYTCNGACVTGASLSSSLFNASNTNITAALLTPPGYWTIGSTERTNLINWVRGADNRNNEDLNFISTDIRARIHGDLLHSRPAVVNYNRTADERDIMVYYGTNGGVFHAVKGGQDDADGGEKWGIVFPEFFDKLKRLRDNSPAISSTSPKPYFADGPVSVFQQDVDDDGKYVANNGDKVYLYVGMRRGGRFAYALDVSDPDNPKHLWKIDDTMAGFTELGQTWSTLRPARIRALAESVNPSLADDPVVIFGAGYDAQNEDDEPASTNNKGRGIFVVNGRTGALIKHILPAGMGSVPADLAVLDRDENGLFDRIYAADTKGNIWRVDIDDADPANWQAHKLAALGGSGADARKFLNKPDVVFGADYDAILIGSGDREHPFEKTVTNRFYMLKDTKLGLTGGMICDTDGIARSCLENDLTDVTLNPYQNTTTSMPHGWYLTLDEGEKVVGNAITVFGTTFFGTNRPLPSDSSCNSNLGEARMYAVGYAGGQATVDTDANGEITTSDRFELVAGGGFPPSPVYTRVEVDGKTVDAVCTGSHCVSPGGVTTTTNRFRTYWHIQQ
jgi:type IV pilus assembly protein PilY1